MEKQNYSFATALSMVVGIVIGSGIFFKADDILLAVNGNILVGVAEFFFVGLGVLFGTLAISYYTLLDKQHIGLIGYSKMALGKKFAYLVGWFSIAAYFPSFIVTLATVGSIYLAVLLNINSQLFITISTVLFLVSAFTLNIRSPRGGGKIQIIFTIAKIIPLLVIGLIGSIFFTSPESMSTVASNTMSGGKPLSALIAIAFAFDGWIVAANISRELKNSEKNLPRALAWGTVGIILIYCLYFFGITQILDPNTIVELGDAHTEVAATVILGPLGGKIITAFVVISVYGGLNGMTLAYLRLPSLLVETDIMKNIYGSSPEEIERGSILFTIIATGIFVIFQQFISYQLIFSNLEQAFDLSALPIIINYCFYLILFIFVNRLAKQESISKRLYYLFVSSLAGLTAIVVIYGALQVNGLIYIGISLIVLIVGIPFYKK